MRSSQAALERGTTAEILTVERGRSSDDTIRVHRTLMSACKQEPRLTRSSRQEDESG
jgi:hypothetical protein